MVNRRYRKGYRFEHRVKKYLEKMGYKVFRLAGSKPIDLIAVNNEKIVFIECKSGRVTRNMAMDYIRKVGGIHNPNITFAMAVKKDRKIVFIDPYTSKTISLS